MSFDLENSKFDKTHILSIEIEKIKNSVEIVTLKEGTILYRFSKEKSNDNGKRF